MNLCTTCKVDFASVSAFDKHRIGKHAYTYAEGLAMTPERHDGRRCMGEAEMRAAGMAPNDRGRWSIVADAARVAALRGPLKAPYSDREAMIHGG